MSQAKELLYTIQQHVQNGKADIAESLANTLLEQQFEPLLELQKFLLMARISIAKQEVYQAMLYLQQSKDIVQKNPTLKYIAEIEEVHASVLEHIGDYVQAIDYAQEALAIYLKAGIKESVARVSLQIAQLIITQERYSDALPFLQQATGIWHSEPTQKEYIATQLALVQVYYHVGLFSEAYDAIFLLSNLNSSNISSEQFHIIRGWLGLILSQSSIPQYNAHQALEYLSLTVQELDSCNEKKHQRLFRKTLSELYEAQEQWEQAYIHFERYCNLENEVIAQESAKAEQKYTYERQIAVMEKEREVTDKLLQKSFPAFIIPQLKSEKKRIMEEYSPVSVLFADMVGFTKLSTEIKPNTVVQLLNSIFTHFDIIMQKHQCERIRTLGDGYLAICGAPISVPDHAFRLASAALEMLQDYTPPPTISSALPEGTIIEIRIGLHCGPIVAGIVGGLQKWQYDIYGDTVNTASRMESYGEAGKIHVSEEFRNALSEYTEFFFTPREPMYIKGKGFMNTFFLS